MRFIILKHRFNENYALIALDTALSESANQILKDKARWEDKGDLETNDPMIIESSQVKEKSYVQISKELFNSLEV